MTKYGIVFVLAAFAVAVNAQCPNLQNCVDSEIASCGPESAEGDGKQDRRGKKRELMECAIATLTESGFDFENVAAVDETQQSCSHHDAFRACHLQKPWDSRRSSSSSSEGSSEGTSEGTSEEDTSVNGGDAADKTGGGGKIDELKASLVEKTKGGRFKRHRGGHGHHHHGGHGDRSKYVHFKGCRSLLHGEEEGASPPTEGRRCYWSKMKECFKQHKDEIEAVADCQFNEEAKVCNPEVAAAISLCKEIDQTII